MKSIIRNTSLMAALLLLRPAIGMAQDISQIAKSDPLIITGAVGTQNTYYYSSVGSGFASPMSNSFYANLNISLYGFSMPFSLYYSNNNLDFNYPHISFNVSPTYKNWTLHFGRSSMPFNSYIFNTSFNGVGVEYRGARLRFGAFYGQLRNAINDDPANPRARMPQYKRTGWGLKLGYGTSRNYLDLYVFRAKDRPGSIDEAWHSRISAQENLVLGLRGCVGLKEWVSLSTNVSMSALTSDLNSDKLEVEKVDKYRNIFDARYSSLMRFAGDANLNFSLKGFNASLFYRIVQPDYSSLGVRYMSNNYHALGIMASTSLLNKVMLSANFSGQEDNLTDKQLYTTRCFVYSANASTRIGQSLTLSAGYNGYLQSQGDGTVRVNDTTRVHRVMHSFSLAPSYTLSGQSTDHTFSVSMNYSQNKDLNKFSNGESDVKTFSVGTSYNLNVKSIETDFIASVNHQQSRGYRTRYNSEVLSMGVSRSFLKERNLTTSVDINFCNNKVEGQSRNFSIGANMAANLILKKVHNFSFMAGYNRYQDTNISEDNTSFGADELSVSLNYTYTFSLFSIMSKAHKAEKEKKTM